MTRDMKKQKDLHHLLLEEKIKKLSDEKDMLSALCFVLVAAFLLALLLI